MLGLTDEFIANYANGSDVLDVPIATGSDIYVASTCEYAKATERGLSSSWRYAEISKQDFEFRKEIAGRDNRILDAR